MWFRKNKSEEPAVSQQLVVTPTPANRVEVELAKGANREAVEKAKKVNAHVQDLLEENGFTLKIYIAAGGKPPRKRENAK